MRHKSWDDIPIWGEKAPNERMAPSAFNISPALGWDQSYSLTAYPPREVFNWWWYLISSALRNLAEHGLLPWSLNETYKHPSLTVDTDGKIYRSLAPNKGRQPSKNPELWHPLIDIKLVYATNTNIYHATSGELIVTPEVLVRALHNSNPGPNWTASSENYGLTRIATLSDLDQGLASRVVPANLFKLKFEELPPPTELIFANQEQIRSASLGNLLIRPSDLAQAFKTSNPGTLWTATAEYFGLVRFGTLQNYNTPDTNLRAVSTELLKVVISNLPIPTVPNFASPAQIVAAKENNLLVSPQQLSNALTSTELGASAWAASETHFGFAQLASQGDINTSRSDRVVTAAQLKRAMDATPSPTRLNLATAHAIANLSGEARHYLLSLGGLIEALEVQTMDSRWYGTELRPGFAQLASQGDINTSRSDRVVTAAQLKRAMDATPSPTRLNLATAHAIANLSGEARHYLLSLGGLIEALNVQTMNSRWYGTELRPGFAQLASQGDINTSRSDRVVTAAQLKRAMDATPSPTRLNLATAHAIANLANNHLLTPNAMAEALSRTDLNTKWKGSTTSYGVTKLATKSDVVQRDATRVVSAALLASELENIPLEHAATIEEVAEGAIHNKFITPRTLAAMFRNPEKKYQTGLDKWGLYRETGEPTPVVQPVAPDPARWPLIGAEIDIKPYSRKFIRLQDYRTGQPQNWTHYSDILEYFHSLEIEVGNNTIGYTALPISLDPQLNRPYASLLVLRPHRLYFTPGSFSGSLREVTHNTGDNDFVGQLTLDRPEAIRRINSVSDGGQGLCELEFGVPAGQTQMQPTYLRQFLPWRPYWTRFMPLVSRQSNARYNILPSGMPKAAIIEGLLYIPYTTPSNQIRVDRYDIREFNSHYEFNDFEAMGTPPASLITGARNIDSTALLTTSGTGQAASWFTTRDYFPLPDRNLPSWWPPQDLSHPFMLSDLRGISYLIGKDPNYNRSGYLRLKFHALNISEEDNMLNVSYSLSNTFVIQEDIPEGVVFSPRRYNVYDFQIFSDYENLYFSHFEDGLRANGRKYILIKEVNTTSGRTTQVGEMDAGDGRLHGYITRDSAALSYIYPYPESWRFSRLVNPTSSLEAAPLITEPLYWWEKEHLKVKTGGTPLKIRSITGIRVAS